ncbi:signal peptidase I [Histidinibacterium aquaticum]|uniref:Signal peptidase I n=1 Tax=Histidinibacterium aquaticum TaxID=2613962 RepID=A0A5J5GFT3_9RHOB|nr:signal peptidase I [Histidinibacterium aquaticum]KAA9007079.1 signal peptidase I [Histidinibacterium aquaticum]
MRALRGFFVGGFDWDGSAGRGPVIVALVTLIAIVFASPLISSATGGRLSPAQVDSVLSALVLVQLFGTIVRRLHDAGRSGWWLLLAILPYMPALMLLALLALPRNTGPVRRETKVARRVGLALTCLLALFLLSRFFWTDHLVEDETMSPALQSGDYVAALTLFRAPERGEVVIHDTPGARDQVMRVVGLPGERVTQTDEGLAINNTPAGYASSGDAVTETLPGGASHQILPFAGGPASLVAEVPEGYVLLLGDNRPFDAAFASQARLSARIVPASDLRGRVVRIIASSDSWRGGLPAWVAGMRWDRVWSAPW